MTQAIAEIVKIENLFPVENADLLNIAEIGGYQIVVKKTDFQLGDIGLFISVDSVVPLEFLEFYNLHERIPKGRIKTAKLRGVYSQGLLLPLTHPTLHGAKEGDDFREELGIFKYQPPVQFKGLDTRPWPTSLLRIYDIESLQSPKYRNIFQEGEEVVVTEKVHGKHIVAGIFEDNFFVCTRRTSLKKPDDPKLNEYWYVVHQYNLEEKLKAMMEEFNVSSIAIRGELFGPKCQFLHYGRKEVDFVCFDIEVGLGNYLSHDELVNLCVRYSIQAAPVIYRGPFNYKKIEGAIENDSSISLNPGELQEGGVIKPVLEQSHYSLGRKILKQISKRYALKAGKELEYAD